MTPDSDVSQPMSEPRVSDAELELASEVIEGMSDVPDDPDTSPLIVVMRNATLDLRDARAALAAARRGAEAAVRTRCMECQAEIDATKCVRCADCRRDFCDAHALVHFAAEDIALRDRLAAAESALKVEQAAHAETRGAVNDHLLKSAPIAAAFRDAKTTVTHEQYDGFLESLAALQAVMGDA